jgi:hypothetical protein
MEDNNASQKHIDIFIVANHLKQQIIRKLKGIQYNSVRTNID